MSLRLFQLWCSCLVKLFVLLLVCQLLLFYITKMQLVVLPRSLQPTLSFADVMRAQADADNYVILAMVDEAFVDMAVNLYEMSLRPNNINNFLFVGVGNKTCELVRGAGVDRVLPCYHFTNDDCAAVASSYGAKDFIRKMNIRTEMILEALSVNLTVVHTDLDVVLFINPLDEIKKFMQELDLAALWDASAYNAGFIVIKPTGSSIELYELVRQMTNDSAGAIDDQRALNRVIEIQRQNKTSHLRVDVLDKQRYQCGLAYFENSNRLFPRNNHSCAGQQTDKNCVAVVHNNWIVSKEGKVYRFKEHLMWMYDANGTYYGSETNRYMTYNNTSPLSISPLFNSPLSTSPLSTSPLSISPLSTYPLSTSPLSNSPLSTSPLSTSSLFNSTDQSLVNKVDREKLTVEELDALKAALATAQLLNRILILPRFHCGADEHDCPLNSLIKIAAFDAKFADRYRENIFLQHPKVPAAIKNSVSELVSLSVGNATRVNGTLVKQTANSERIVELFGSRRDAVLVFETFSGIVVNFSGKHAGDVKMFENKIKGGFQRAAYRQF